MSILGEIKRRKVFQVAAVYAVVAWLTIQVVDVVAEPLVLPSWLATVVIVLLAAGFPVSLVLAWAFDLTPDASTTAVETPRGASGPRAPAPISTYVIQGLVLLAVGLLVVDRYVLDGVRDFERNSVANGDRQPAVTRFAHVIPSDARLRSVDRNAIALSPDGRRLVYNTTAGLYLRELAELEARLVPGTREDLTSPFFTPDSQAIAFADASGAIRTITRNGGESEVVHAGLGLMLGASWGENGEVYVAYTNVGGDLGGGIYRISADRAAPDLVAASPFGGYLAAPELLPGGDAMIYAQWYTLTGLVESAEILARSTITDETATLVHGGTHPRYLPSGHLIYVSDNSLYGVRFDASTLRVLGAAVLLVPGIDYDPRSALSSYDVSDDGTLAYLSGSAISGLNTLVWIDRQGHEEAIDIPTRNYIYAQLSPDGTRVALDSRDDESHIWIFDLERDVLQRLTLASEGSFSPVWVDNDNVAFARAGPESSSIYIQTADRSGEPVLVTEATGGGVLWPTSVSPDGATLFYRTDEPFGIWRTSLADDSEDAEMLLPDAASETNPALSPDGRWLAYQSNESGKDEIYVRPYPELESRRIKISRDGGTRPLWRRDGRELYYLVSTEGGQAALMAVAVDTEQDFVAGIPELLFENKFRVPNRGRQVYDVSGDGQRFLMIQSTAESGAEDAPRDIVIVQNWIEEVKRRIP